MAHIGDVQLPAPEHEAVRNANGVAYVRPHEIELSDESGTEAAIPALVEAVSIAGPVLRVELRHPMGSDLIHVEVQRTLPLAGRIAAGQTVFARPRASRVFLQ
ncbi:TOBE-like domain-containing protein [Alcanivorax quisquiliarum]|uniref:TOBE-like domain-containing protein n=1 Tax=Alcanivorax quisquiliarum TaxID=2933565 RepID=A0ABT0E671_9GAMM|nr:TOBE-like domain-containing protein [Alcanivorax quisquiliarum]